MPKIGFPGGLFFAPNTADDVDISPIYGAMVKMLGVNSAKIKFTVDDKVFYYEDLPQELVRYISGAEVEFTAQSLTLAQRAVLLGHTVIGGIVAVGAGDTPIFVGLAFKIKKSNGKFQYVRLLKGYMEPPDEEAQSREEKLNPKDYTLKFTFMPRKYDDKVVEMTDEDLPSYVAADGANWLTTFGATDTVPPTIASSVPTTNATGVAVGSSYAWTFSEAIPVTCVTPANFFLIKDSDNSIVAGTLAQSGDKLTVTFTPTGNLTASSAYFAVATRNITDLAGNALAANTVRKFTTA